MTTFFQIKISQCCTKSTQTVNSQFRNTVGVQVAPRKNKKVQTRKDGSTNTDQLLTYISGLREKCQDCYSRQAFWDKEPKKQD